MVRAAFRLAWLVALALPLASCSTQAPPAVNESPAGNGAAHPGSSAVPVLFQSPRKGEGEIKIRIITNGISPFWDPMAAGMRKAAQELGCEADWAGPQPAEVGLQRQLVEQALAAGADGVALSCIEADASRPIIDMVLDKGVPVITFDADSPGSRRLCYIGTNNFEAGRAAGQEAVKLLPEGGKFVAFVGNISAQNARERRDGFLEAVKGHGIEIIQVYDDNKDANRAQQNVEYALARYGNEIKGFLGLFSYNGPAIARVLTGKGVRDRYRVVCFDAELGTLEALEKGNIDATVVQKPYDFGYLSTRLLYLINRKGWEAARQEMNIPANGIYDTGVEVVTPANVREFRAKLARIGVKQS